MKVELRYWRAVLRAAEAELDAATTNRDLQIAARKFMRARRHITRLTKQQASRTTKRRHRSSNDQP